LSSTYLPSPNEKYFVGGLWTTEKILTLFIIIPLFVAITSDNSPIEAPNILNGIEVDSGL
jgi:hypothetical protein